MQRLKSLRRSISSKSSRRRSGASFASSNESPRRSHDTGASTASPSSSTHDLTSSPAASKTEDAETRDAPESSVRDTPPPAYRVNDADDGSAAAEARVAPQSLTTSVSDPPVIVEPPSPSPAEGEATTATTASGREAPADASLRHRKGSLTAGDVAATSTEEKEEEKAAEPVPAKMPVPRSWVVFAVASGGFAALNGVFAKLTTADLTSTISKTISARFKLNDELVNPVVRGFFFLLNLVSNAIMWGLFTRALTAHPSATKVSLINTSANFLVTAILGALIFAEALPASWFGGAALLVLGTLIIGRDRAGEAAAASSGAQANGDVEGSGGPRSAMEQKGMKKPNAAATELNPLLAGDEK